MKIDTDAFVDSLPIMGNGLLGIFIVTIVIIICIYILRALTSKKAESEAAAQATGKTDVQTSAMTSQNAAGVASANGAASASGQTSDQAGSQTAANATAAPTKKESAMDLMREREKKDFLETEDSYDISNDL